MQEREREREREREYKKRQKSHHLQRLTALRLLPERHRQWQSRSREGRYHWMRCNESMQESETERGK